MIEPRIATVAETKFIGMRREMSFAKDQTAELWKAFMPRLTEVVNRQSNSLYSLQTCGKDFDSGPNTPFEKWALAPVAEFTEVPEGMETFTLEPGKYAVFDYKGPAGSPEIFRYIFEQWLPASGFLLDDRPHFEVLGEGYRNHGPDSEEEIWIPVRPSSEKES